MRAVACLWIASVGLLRFLFGKDTMTTIHFTPPVDAPGLSLAQVQADDGMYHGTDGNFYLSFKGHVYVVSRNSPTDPDDDTLGEELIEGGSLTFVRLASSFTITGP